MSKKTLFFAFAFILPTALFAASEEAILVSGDNYENGERSVVSGHATAYLSDHTKVTAAEIAYDMKTPVLVCTGDVTVTKDGRTIKAQKLTIELGHNVRMFFLNPKVVQVQVQTPDDLLRAELNPDLASLRKRLIEDSSSTHSFSVPPLQQPLPPRDLR